MLVRILSRICVALLCLWVTLPARAETDGVQLEVVPQSLEITSCGQSSTLLIIARNPTVVAASGLSITSFSDASIDLSSIPALKVLGPGQQISWSAEVNCKADFNSGNLHIVLSDKLARSGGAQVSQIATKSIPVKLRDPQTLDSIAALDVKTTLESLKQGDTGELLVTVTDKLAQPIQATITPSGPSFIKICPSPAPVDVCPPPGKVPVNGLQTMIVPFTVRATGQVRPGKQLLRFQVHLEIGGVPRDSVITREVDVGVLGESDMLKLLGVPSLFFLPGFLAVSSFLLLWRWAIMNPAPAGDPPLEETKSGFWLVSITVSLLISGALILYRKDFFSFYGLGDVARVWVISIAVGCGTYIVYRVIANLLRAWYPQPEDSPTKILHKLKKYGKSMDLSQVKLKGKPEPVFVLYSKDDGAAYVCPEMVLTWKDNANPAIRTIVQQQLQAGGDPGIVADALDSEEAKKKTPGDASGIRQLIWNSSDPLHPSAHKVAETEIDESVEKKEIVLRETN